MTDASRPRGPRAGLSPGESKAYQPHIGFLSSSAPLGPRSSYSPFILQLATSVQRMGFRVTILAPHVAGSLETEVLEGVEVRRYRYLRGPESETLGLGGGMLPGLRARPFDMVKVPAFLLGQYRALGRLHAGAPIDVLHSHWILPQGLIGGLWASRHGIPHVSTIHGSDLLGLRFPGFRAALGWTVAHCDEITVGSEAAATVLRRHVPDASPVVVPIGIDTPECDVVVDNVSRRRRIAGGRPLVGFVGRLTKEKGIDDFVRVIASLHSRERDVAGIVVGGGAMGVQAKALAKKLGVDRCISFAGAVEPREVFGFLSIIDLLVVPSRHEGQGLAAIEAMRMGVPIVATTAGGLADVVQHERTGLAVPTGDVEALADQIERLLTDRDLLERLSLAGLERVERDFSLDATTGILAGIYRRATREG